MKKLTLIITLFIVSTLNANAQKKDTTAKQPMDTVITGYRVVIVMDSLQYKNLSMFMSRLPIENEDNRYIFDLISGKMKNVFREPIFMLKPKKKK